MQTEFERPLKRKMTMISDEKRREVAQKLRELHPEDRCWFGIHGFDWFMFADSLFDAIRCNGIRNWTDYLADLIEPTCDHDALLELANDMAGMFRIGAVSGEGLDAKWCRELHDKYASYIHEALGENS